MHWLVSVLNNCHGAHHDAVETETGALSHPRVKVPAAVVFGEVGARERIVYVVPDVTGTDAGPEPICVPPCQRVHHAGMVSVHPVETVNNPVMTAHGSTLVCVAPVMLR
jgi:hypothetical protein